MDPYILPTNVEPIEPLSMIENAYQSSLDFFVDSILTPSVC